MPLIPRDEGFFALFNALASKMKTAADLLRSAFSEPSRLDHFAAAIKVVEHEADSITHDVATRLDRSFVTPLDREDIYRLTQELDTVVDLIDGTARRATMFQLTESRPYAEQLAGVLEQTIGVLEKSVREVKDRRAVAKYSIEVKRLEEQGDMLYADAIRDLFQGRPDPIDVIKWKEVYDTLEEAVDRCKTAAILLESISLKNS